MAILLSQDFNDDTGTSDGSSLTLPSGWEKADGGNMTVYSGQADSDLTGRQNSAGWVFGYSRTPSSPTGPGGAMFPETTLGSVGSIGLIDTYGDGWHNNNFVSVSVNGNPVLTNITLPSGHGPLWFDFEANPGDSVLVSFTPGSYPSECQYKLNDASQGAGNTFYISPTYPSTYGFSAPAFAAGPPPSGTWIDSSSERYMYIESSGWYNKYNLIRTQAIDLSSVTGSVTMTFWFHMFGVNMGNLGIAVTTATHDASSAFEAGTGLGFTGDNTGGATITYWTNDDGSTTATGVRIIGQQQTEGHSDPLDPANYWRKATVDLSAAVGESTVYIYFFCKSGGSYRSDLAIDAFEIVGPPTSPPTYSAALYGAVAQVAVMPPLPSGPENIDSIINISKDNIGTIMGIIYGDIDKINDID